MRDTTIPEKLEIVDRRTDHQPRLIEFYERYHRHLAAWVDREVQTLLVQGPPGVGKSCGYRNALGNRPHHLLGGRQSPLHVYTAIYDSPHQHVVLDDIAALLCDDNFRDLLKGLCETGERTIRWGTTTSKLEGRANSVVCTCPVLIVINRIPPRDPDLAAVLDRCDAIRFVPTKAEIIARMRELWPNDGSLIDLIAVLPTMPSLRTLVKARQWAGSKHLDLIEELLDECHVPAGVERLVEIMETTPKTEWCERYVVATGETSRTYRRHRPIAEQLVACRKSVGRCPDVRDPAAQGGVWPDPKNPPGPSGKPVERPHEGTAETTI